ncbi:MAG: hypothetical protein HY938_08840 [Nitrosomonadales bacterium]|nr:hypothetical protein [Nitrosomonadales bacterium]
MIRLGLSLHAWGTPDFADVFKREVAQHAAQLPLQRGLAMGSHVLDTPVSVAINSITELNGVIRIRAGIFFQSVIAGCSCADDPTPVSEINEYCEMCLDIDKATAATTVALVTE